MNRDVLKFEPTATTRRGDLYLLGDHRLLCGDSSSSDDVDRLTAGAAIGTVNTDPPYNVAVKSQAKSDRAKLRPLLNDSMKASDFEPLAAKWFGQMARVLAPGRACYIWGGHSNLALFPRLMADAGLHFANTIVWVKNGLTLSFKDYKSKHELCFYGWRKGAPHEFFGPKNAVDVWPENGVHWSRRHHLTEKPIGLAERAITASTQPGEHVLDLFGGSGSTLFAAEKLSRKACLMELDPLHCDSIVRRWEQQTGRKATLLESSAQGRRRRAA